MSTPNTPAPGTPEWLRKRADDEQSADAKVTAIFGANPFADGSELIAGLRAAAERIEQLERASKDLIALAAEHDEENDRLRVELVVLRDEKAGIHASEANYIRQCAELSDENAELKRVQDALKKEVAAANKGARTNALVNESLVAKERELRAAAERIEELERAVAEYDAENAGLREQLSRRHSVEEDTKILDWIDSLAPGDAFRILRTQLPGYVELYSGCPHTLNALPGIREAVRAQWRVRP